MASIEVVAFSKVPVMKISLYASKENFNTEVLPLVPVKPILGTWNRLFYTPSSDWGIYGFVT